MLTIVCPVRHANIYDMSVMVAQTAIYSSNGNGIAMHEMLLHTKRTVTCASRQCDPTAQYCYIDLTVHSTGMPARTAITSAEIYRKLPLLGEWSRPCIWQGRHDSSWVDV